jgi:omega-amidase
MRIVLIQTDVTIGQPLVNRERVLSKMQECMTMDPPPDTIVLPEMWNTGYALEQIGDIADEDGEPTRSIISSFARMHNVNVIAGSVANKSANGIKNTLLAFNRAGECVAEYSKLHLFRLMDEDKYLVEGDALGFVSLDQVTAGLMICYDIRFPELARKLALAGAKVLFVAAQWPKPRLHHWRILLQARAIENQLFVVACNRIGSSRESEFFGHSMIISPWGEVLAEGGEEEQWVSATIDLAETVRVRSKIPVFTDRRPEIY